MITLMNVLKFVSAIPFLEISNSADVEAHETWQPVKAETSDLIILLDKDTCTETHAAAV